MSPRKLCRALEDAQTYLGDMVHVPEACGLGVYESGDLCDVLREVRGTVEAAKKAVRCGHVRE